MRIRDGSVWRDLGGHGIHLLNTTRGGLLGDKLVRDRSIGGREVTRDATICGRCCSRPSYFLLYLELTDGYDLGCCIIS
jgi:hypothetical protein